jgi:hypothetical protein
LKKTEKLVTGMESIIDLIWEVEEVSPLQGGGYELNSNCGFGGCGNVGGPNGFGWTSC